MEEQLEPPPAVLGDKLTPKPVALGGIPACIPRLLAVAGNKGHPQVAVETGRHGIDGPGQLVVRLLPDRKREAVTPDRLAIHPGQVLRGHIAPSLRAKVRRLILFGKDEKSGQADPRGIGAAGEEDGAGYRLGHGPSGPVDWDCMEGTKASGPRAGDTHSGRKPLLREGNRPGPEPGNNRTPATPAKSAGLKVHRTGRPDVDRSRVGDLRAPSLRRERPGPPPAWNRPCPEPGPVPDCRR